MVADIHSRLPQAMEARGQEQQGEERERGLRPAWPRATVHAQSRLPAPMSGKDHRQALIRTIEQSYLEIFPAQVTSPLLVTCAVCRRLHEPKNPLLTNPICGTCTKPGSG